MNQSMSQTSEIRELSADELDAVNGGIAPLVAAFFAGAMVGVTVGGFIHGAQMVTLGPVVREF